MSEVLELDFDLGICIARNATGIANSIYLDNVI